MRACRDPTSPPPSWGAVGAPADTNRAPSRGRCAPARRWPVSKGFQRKARAQRCAAAPRPLTQRGPVVPPSFGGLLSYRLSFRLVRLRFLVQLEDHGALTVSVLFTLEAVVDCGERNVGLGEFWRLADDRLQPGARLLRLSGRERHIGELVACAQVAGAS